MKRFLSIVLAILMVFSVIGSSAPFIFAESDGQKGSAQSTGSSFTATASNPYVELTTTSTTSLYVNVSPHSAGPFTYQWYDYNNNPVGSNDEYYSLDTFSVPGTYIYKCEVSNGSDTQTVDFEVHILRFGANCGYSYPGDTFSIGDPITLTVYIDGQATPDPITYQWYYDDGTMISGATSSNYFIAQYNLGDPCKYYCMVTDQVETIRVDFKIPFSNDLYVEHYSGGNWFILPVHSSITLDQNYFTVYANDKKDITYQWYKENSSGVEEAIPGATEPYYTISDLTEFTNLGLWVRDRYDNEWYVQFHVEVKNNFSAGTEHAVFSCDPNGVEFKVFASADTGSITYNWYEYINGEKSLINNTSTDPTTLSVAPTSTTMYTCVASDIYKKKEEVNFLVENSSDIAVLKT